MTQPTLVGRHWVNLLSEKHKHEDIFLNCHIYKKNHFLADVSTSCLASQQPDTRGTNIQALHSNYLILSYQN